MDIYNFFREVCSKYFQDNLVQLGGHVTIVEIDESCFSHKPKLHRGRGPRTAMWVFGLVDASAKPCIGYMEIVDKRNADTLLPIIQKIVKTGSVIHSDEWKTYKRIQQDLGFNHRTVNHSLHFVDRNTQVLTQTIESYWNRQKSCIKAMHGCKRSHLNSYLDEFMWHERHINNTFFQFCKTMTTQYPLN